MWNDGECNCDIINLTAVSIKDEFDIFNWKTNVLVTNGNDLLGYDLKDVDKFVPTYG